ncbi:tethering complex ATP-binding subunit VPS33 [Sporobolomyces salmoneus]|uniref:tethering complex ATP-binding subunit VPS33 n=1 Tax=Sporobolomyces salmoneus TaxID=183962 RepID=UPI003178BD56
MTVDTQLFQLVASSALQGLLDRIVGPKTLILTPSLAGPLGLVTEVGLLKNNHAVTKMFWLEPGPLNQAERNVVYLCRPEVKSMRIIADQIQSTPQTHNHIYHLLIVPRMTSLCTTVLADAGVLGSIDIQDFQLGFIPLDKEVLSLEYEDVYKRIYLDNDPEPIFDLAKALMTLQRAFGTIPRIIGKGSASRRLVDLLKRFHHEQASSSSSNSSIPLANGLIDSMIVLDRQTDLISPLCTQLTYQGLVDEVVSIKHSHVEVDPNLLNPPPAASTSSTPATPNFAASGSGSNVPQKKRKHLLSPTSDPLFGQLRDVNFAVVGSILNRTARRLNEDYEKRHLAKTPQELRAFVGQLGGLQNEHQALRLHTSLTEEIMKLTSTEEFNTALEVQQNLVAGLDLSTQESTIRDLINQEAPLLTVLRLLCLYSLISGGLKPKILEEFKREILQTYGHCHLPLLLSLSRLSLFSRPSPPTSTASSASKKPPFSVARKPLRLIVDDIDESEPTDVSFVFSGYAPLSVRLVQCALGGSAGAGTGNGGSSLLGGGGNGNGAEGRGGGAESLNGWKGLEEVLRGFEGETFEEWQITRGGGKEDVGVQGQQGRIGGELTCCFLDEKEFGTGTNELESDRSGGVGSTGQTPTTVVCFVGGITFAEIAALRFLNRQIPNRNLLIVTTNTLTGGSLLTSLMHPSTRTELGPKKENF